MKKDIQLAVNAETLDKIAEFNDFCAKQDTHIGKPERLFKCNAQTVRVGSRFEVLLSYGTMVALYDYSNSTLYDFLRYVYGYTATSAQHIAKFRNVCQPARFIRWEQA